MTTPTHVRVKDNSLVRKLLTVGRVYEVRGHNLDCYCVEGKWLHKGRFTPATYLEWVEQL